MPACVHVARILPGKKDEFLRRIKDSFEAGREGLRALGFTRVTSFFTPELAGGGDGLLVTVYEVSDLSVVARFYGIDAVIQQEEQAHGTLVAPHDHAAVPTNTPFLELDLRS